MKKKEKLRMKFALQTSFSTTKLHKFFFRYNTATTRKTTILSPLRPPTPPTPAHKHCWWAIGIESQMKIQKINLSSGKQNESYVYLPRNQYVGIHKTVLTIHILGPYCTKMCTCNRRGGGGRRRVEETLIIGLRTCRGHHGTYIRTLQHPSTHHNLWVLVR